MLYQLSYTPPSNTERAGRRTDRRMRIAEPRHLAASARQGKAAKGVATKIRWNIHTMAAIARPVAAAVSRIDHNFAFSGLRR
jgi:hypothetical protein